MLLISRGAFDIYQVVLRVCQPIVDNVKNMICGWRSRLLFFGGRLQLAQSILSIICVYWASVYILLKKVIYEIKKIICNFLWSGNEVNPHRAKVAWREICCPKKQGAWVSMFGIKLWLPILFGVCLLRMGSPCG